MPTANVEQIRRIDTDSSYHGWPTVCRRRSGELLVVSSGGREEHVCPFGQVHLIRSSDDGENWSAPEVLADGPIDDRDAGVIETSQGTLLINWFTSLAWELRMDRAQRGEVEWPRPEQLARWQPRRDALSQAIREREMGHWMIRSTDGGETWSPRYRTPVNSPHGPCELSDGRLLYVGKLASVPGEWTRGSPHAPEKIGAAVSEDDGLTWEVISRIAPAPEHDGQNYHEPHAVEAADGTIVVQIRYHADAKRRETLQTESDDGGRTWSRVHSPGIEGFPSHLVRLTDDRLLTVYGRRNEPFGNRARLSDDCGRSWSEEMIVSDDGDCGDLGYPSSVQLGDGAIYTVWYESSRAHPKAILRGGRWRIED